MEPRRRAPRLSGTTLQQSVRLGEQVESLASSPKASEHRSLANREEASSCRKLGSGGISSLGACGSSCVGVTESFPKQDEEDTSVGREISGNSHATSQALDVQAVNNGTRTRRRHRPNDIYVSPCSAHPPGWCIPGSRPNASKHD